MVNSFQVALMEGLFPNYCVLCGLRSHRNLPLCTPCRAELAANQHSCARCALPLAPASIAGTSCGQCQQAAPGFSHVLAPWLYCEYMAYLIQRWKFHREQRLTALLADLWLERTEPRPNVDLVVPIPLHWRRQWQRGYNQAELLAAAILKRGGDIATGKLETRLLRRTRATLAQSGMDAARRSANLQDAFTAKRPCDNLRIAVVDDVFTTGATASAATAALLAAGAQEVEIWCLARTPAPGD